jgi:hypothetical protein
MGKNNDLKIFILSILVVYGITTGIIFAIIDIYKRGA